MLRWLAAEAYTGRGAICDLGSFLGGSTAALADGLAAWRGAGTAPAGAGDPGLHRVHSYDRHRIRPEAWERWGLAGRYPYPEDGFFLPVMRDLLGDLDELVTIHSGDFPQLAPPGGPVEILFVDIAKTRRSSDHVLAGFFPKLVPGTSIVVQQDYFHAWPFFDVYAMEVLSDWFEPLATAGTSALFLLTRPLAPEAVAAALSARMTMAALRAALASAAGRWPEGPERAAILGMHDALDGLDAVPGTEPEFQRARAAAGTASGTVPGMAARPPDRGRAASPGVIGKLWRRVRR